MNILIPDSWLREYLVTKATPQQIKEYLSLCGPSVERMHREGNDVVYDIEITTNRPDAMSVVGIAREAAAILPRFGIPAKLAHDPYAFDTKTFIAAHKKEGVKKLAITTDPALNPRWTTIVLSAVTVKKSPEWLRRKLEATGIRSLNNVIDITNYLMRAYGQPAHAFDYDEIKPKNGVPTMLLRASRKGEKLKTLDGKTHVLPGDDIVIEDGAGRLIDLCGIMGAENSSIKDTTTSVVLFMQTYNPVSIRRTSMSLAHRTEAASLFEKGLDSELVLPTIMEGVRLMEELTGGKVVSKLYDVYPKPFIPYEVSVTHQKTASYLGVTLSDKQIGEMLRPLGFMTNITKQEITVTPPSFRPDVAIDVDIIEEIARIYGYHNIRIRLPDTEPPIIIANPQLSHEHEIKIRLRDWGYTETYTYSMISKTLMDLFSLPKQETYSLTNPLSAEWVYMRPSLVPSMLTTVEQNLHFRQSLSLFEISMVYEWKPGELPHEKPMLVVAKTGDGFRQMKGLAEAVFSQLGIPFPADGKGSHTSWMDPARSLKLGAFGSVGQVNTKILADMQIKLPVTLLELDFEALVTASSPGKTYIPIPKYPALVEDLAFVVPGDTTVAELIDTLKNAHARIQTIALLDAYQNSRTLRVTYLDTTRTLTSEDVLPIREKLIRIAKEKFGATLRGA